MNATVDRDPPRRAGDGNIDSRELGSVLSGLG
jgi:hypothetical protein